MSVAHVRALLVACVVALFALVNPRAEAQSTAPPWLEWYTLETPHFRIHFHEGPNQYEVAQKVARICEQAHALLSPLMRWTPTVRTEVLLTDDVDNANGSATAYLRPTMTLYAESPDDRSVLNDYEDYLWLLVVHEYTHILHLDTSYGPPELLNRLFGRVWKPNGITPKWMTEGLATYSESNLSAAGRARSSLFDMWLRSSIMERRPFRLDEASNVPTAWPGASLAYLYGGRFIRYVADRLGPERLPDYFANFGSRLVPYALNAAAQESLQIDWIRLYDDWIAALRKQYSLQLDQVRAAGLTPYRLLTRTGYGTDLPRFSADGSRIFFVEAGTDRAPAIRSFDAQGHDERLEVELWQGATYDVSPDLGWVVFSASDIFRERYVYEDLFLVERATAKRSRLTQGLRATEPVFSPDGRKVAFVGRLGSGATYLGELELGSGILRRLYTPSREERVFTPTYTPDGRNLVFTQQAGMYRRLRSLALDSRELRTLHAPPYLVLEPTVARDGSVVFTSDRTGIYNLHRWDASTGNVTQLTNVESGMFRPSVSPDGAWVAFSSYSARGYDIGLMRTRDGMTGPSLPERAPRPQPVYQDDPRQVFAPHPYRAWRTLEPLYWSPLLYQDPLGTGVGASTGGGDIVGRHRYAAQVTYGLVSDEPGFALSYTHLALNPEVTFNVSSNIAQALGFPLGLYDRRWTLGVGTGLSFQSLEWQVSHLITLGYEWRTFEPHYSAVLIPDGPLPRFPKAGSTGTIAMGWTVSNAEASANAISLERGGTLNFTARRSGNETLGTFAFLSFESRLQTYLTLPWAAHHVLATRASFGVASGNIGERNVFGLGGLSLEEPLLQLLQGGGAGAGFLRGYPPGVLTGNSFLLGTAEYRFPLLKLDRGAFTLPFFVRRLHGTVFADLGTAGNEALAMLPPRTAVGAELRLELLVGYATSSLLRLGYARGLGPEGLTSIYLTLGNSF